jgi:hypothetical protein
MSGLSERKNDDDYQRILKTQFAHFRFSSNSPSNFPFGGAIAINIIKAVKPITSVIASAIITYRLRRSFTAALFDA